MAQFPACPPQFKSLQHYLKIAAEHDQRDPVISYWCRLYTLQQALKIDKKSLEAVKLLSSLMDWLEKTKNAHKENESITNELAAHAYLENHALKMFLWADSQDRSAIFNKNVVKAFYTAGMLFDVLETFGELSESIIQNRKYSKWKASYIHNCLKNGETPIPGPMNDDEEGEENATGPMGFINPGPGPSNDGGYDNPAPPPSTAMTPSDNFLPSVPSSAPRYVPEPQSNEFTPAASTTKTEGSLLGAEKITKAQKYCKWASSALNYDDVPTAINNLQKALQLLQTGQDS